MASKQNDDQKDTTRHELNLDAQPSDKLAALLLSDVDEIAVDEDVRAGLDASGLLEDLDERALQDVEDRAKVVAGIGALVREARHQSDVGLRELARRLDVSPSRVAAVEKKVDADLEVQTLLRYAAQLGFDLEITLRPHDPARAPVTTILRTH